MQKFSVIYNKVNAGQHNFAIIVDEAHSSQTGQAAQKLNLALADTDAVLEEYAKLENKEENKLCYQLKAQLATHGNYLYFIAGDFMIRKFRNEDLDRIMEIWLNSNLQAHAFISKNYWISNVDMVKSMLPMADVYVYEENNHVEAFVGIDNRYIAGIFVSENVRSKGIGRLLLEKCKNIYKKLSLCVYEKNGCAVKFYLREGFAVQTKRTDINTGEREYFMTWE